MTIAPRGITGLFSVVFVTLALGCGGSGPPTDPGPLKEPDKIAGVLPSGVTLETPVNPDKFYGESSKTVAEALASLQAYVRAGVLYDGIGHEIHFDNEPPAKIKKGKGPRAPRTVISIKK